MPPSEVRALRPTEVAAILGLDRTDTIVPVPLQDSEIIDTKDVDPSDLAVGRGEQRLRRVI